jgi:SAM-dependent methyltransferase
MEHDRRIILPPVEAYGRIASRYADISQRRRSYLDAVERLIVSPAQSLLDVGAGDGSRSLRIAQACGATRVVLLEPSAEMRALQPVGVTQWAMRAEDLAGVTERFDLILCLWNVLGHIEDRAGVLRQFGRLGDSIYVDVNHQYNAAEYGLLKSFGRFLRGASGDVTVDWGECSTRGHVFSDREFRSLARSAGLRVNHRFVIDYATGRPRRFSWQGNLLYAMSPASVSHTS